jgi:hypothetical protein
MFGYWSGCYRLINMSFSPSFRNYVSWILRRQKQRTVHLMPIGEYRPVPKPAFKRGKPSQRQRSELPPQEVKRLIERSEGVCEKCNSARATGKAHAERRTLKGAGDRYGYRQRRTSYICVHRVITGAIQVLKAASG